jgi:uncharacterized protein YecE (DUF72 family)
MTEYHIGTSGWYYPHWQVKFYPYNMTRSRWLEYYSQHFNTVELNNTFYRLPADKTFNTWQISTPASFIFSVKASRFITHIKRLRNLDDTIDRFITRAKLLKQKLGPLLYQLHPQIKRDNKLLADFLYLLPAGFQHVFEFRDKSWFDEQIFQLLNDHGAGFCIYDMPDNSTPLISTADFAYIRFHGSQDLYGSNYSNIELRKWAKLIKDDFAGLRNIYIYFNNDNQGFAVKNAICLKKLLMNQQIC